MNDKLAGSSRSESVLSMDQKELSCGGQPCSKCGACRDWHQSPNNDNVVKRNYASCNCDYMYRHQLVPNPDHYNNIYSPVYNLICTCRDNY